MKAPHRDRVPDLFVEQLALGELPEPRARAVAARLSADPDAAGRLAALAQDDAATLAAHPPERVALAIEARLRAARAARAAASRRHGWVWPALATGLAAALVLVLVRPAGGPTGGSDTLPGELAPGLDLDLTRPKGPTAPRLAVFRQDAAGPERLAEGALVAPRDTLQLGYLAASDTHGVLVSIDGRGAVTLHFPDRADADTTLVTPGEVTLAHAYELDDAPGFERFLFVTAARPLDPAAVVDAARRLAAAPDRGEHGAFALPGADHVASFVVHKEGVR